MTTEEENADEAGNDGDIERHSSRRVDFRYDWMTSQSVAHSTTPVKDLGVHI